MCAYIAMLVVIEFVPKATYLMCENQAAAFKPLKVINGRNISKMADADLTVAWKRGST